MNIGNPTIPFYKFTKFSKVKSITKNCSPFSKFWISSLAEIPNIPVIMAPALEPDRTLGIKSCSIKALHTPVWKRPKVAPRKHKSRLSICFFTVFKEFDFFFSLKCNTFTRCNVSQALADFFNIIFN